MSGSRDIFGQVFGQELPGSLPFGDPRPRDPISWPPIGDAVGRANDRSDGPLFPDHSSRGSFGDPFQPRPGPWPPEPLPPLPQPRCGFSGLEGLHCVGCPYYRSYGAESHCDLSFGGDPFPRF